MIFSKISFNWPTIDNVKKDFPYSETSWLNMNSGFIALPRSIFRSNVPSSYLTEQKIIVFFAIGLVGIFSLERSFQRCCLPSVLKWSPHFPLPLFPFDYSLTIWRSNALEKTFVKSNLLTFRRQCYKRNWIGALLQKHCLKCSYAPYL